MSSASFGAGTYQIGMTISLSLPCAGFCWEGVRLDRARGDQHGSSRQRIDDDDPGMPGNGLVGPGGERLAAAAHGQQHLTWAIYRNGYSNPPDRADQAVCRATFGVHGHITGFRVMRLYWYTTAL